MAFEGIFDFLTDSSFYVYLAIFLLGLAWVVIGLILGGLADLVDVAADAVGTDVDADGWGQRQVGLSPFSPLMLAVFGMLFGVLGMAFSVFTSMALLPVLGIALGGSIVLDAGVYGLLYGFFVQSQASSVAAPSEAVGSDATVATRVGPGLTGTVDLVVAGKRSVARARPEDDGVYEVGDVVEVVSIDGGVARIRRRAG